MEKLFDVVISGVSGRFPECDDVLTLKQKLCNGENTVTEDNRKWNIDHYSIENERFTISNALGKYTEDKAYDYRVFKLNDKSARSSNAQNRKVLEPGFEAIVDAGINPYSLDGANIGVFATCGMSEGDNNFYCDQASYGAFLMVGSARTMIANRLSYSFNLTGPSVTFISNLLGDIDAVLTGYRLISQGFIEAALVVTSAHVLDPRISLQYLGLNLLSPNKENKVFDQGANGFSRSEATVALYLQRATEAKRNYGTILGCSAYFGGSKSAGVLDYDVDVMYRFLSDLYDENDNQKAIEKLGFMELSSHGLKNHDAVEVNALEKVISVKRKNPLLIGSIVSNIGHPEVSAPYMSLLKVILSMDNGLVPPNINFSKPSNYLNGLKTGNLKVCQKTEKLEGDVAGVNVLGLAGNMGHILLKQNSKTPINSRYANLPRLLLICGRSVETLGEIVEKIEKMPLNVEFVALANDVFTGSMPLHLYRGYVILPKAINSRKEILEKGDPSRPIWFVFSGMGSQWNGMGKALLKIPLFAEIIEKCDTVLRVKGLNIFQILTSDDSSIFDNILNSFVGIICVQLGLIEILKALNIHPDGIIGHSVGENACAYADGCLTLEQAVLASYERGKASTAVKTIKGMMAAIGKGYEEMKDLMPADIEVACHNSSTSCTISGPSESVETFVKKLKEDGVFAKSVNVANIAYHSKYIAPAAPLLLSSLKKVIPEPKERSSKWFSTSVPECEWNSPLAKTCSAEYLTNNLLSPVRFEETCKHIPDSAILIEIAPTGLLQAILKKAFPQSCTSHITLTQRNKTECENINTLLSAIGKLYIAGCEPNVNALYPKIEYPVSRGTPSLSPFCSWLREEADYSVQFEILKNRPPLSTELIPLTINDDSEYNFLTNHKIRGTVTVPLSFFLYLIWQRFLSLKNNKLESTTVIFRELRIYTMLTLNLKTTKYISIMIQGSGAFEVNQEDKITGTSTVLLSGQIEISFRDIPINVEHEKIDPVQTYFDQEDIYSIFQKICYELRDQFRIIKRVEFFETYLYGEIKPCQNWLFLLESMFKFQMLEKTKMSFLSPHPTFIREITICNQQLENEITKSIIICHNDLISKHVRCNGIEIRDIQWEISPVVENFSFADVQSELAVSSESKHSKINNIIKSPVVNIKYYRLHNHRTNINNSQKTLGVEYVGIHNSGQYVMGLATIEEQNSFINIDSDLMWTVPSVWNLKEAVGIPLIYSQVHYILQIANIRDMPLTTLLILGKEKHLAEAFISEWLNQNFNIYISVATAEEEQWVSTRFKEESKLHMVHHDNSKYEYQILTETRGLGVDLVVNCVPDIKHTQACMNCLGQFSCYVQVGKENCKNKNNIGLHTFLKNVSVSILPENPIDYVCLPKNRKTKIKENIKNGIEKGTVKPQNEFKNGVCSPLKNIDGIHENLLKKSANTTLRLDKSYTYLIIGESRGISWLRILEWLVNGGCTKFIIALDRNSLRPQSSRQLKKLQKFNNCFIFMTMYHSKMNIVEAMRIVNEAHRVAPLEAVFLASVDSQMVKVMSIVLQKVNSPSYLVSFFSGGLESCEHRRNQGYPGVAVEGHNNNNVLLGKTINDLGLILTNNDVHRIPSLLKINGPVIQTKTEYKVPSLSKFLPEEISELEEYGKSIATTLKFVELNSLSPKYEDTVGVYPVFMVPSIHEKHMQLLAERILYPVFSATISHTTDSIKKMAQILYTDLIAIQSTGPVTIISETWNSVISIELAILLRQHDRQCSLFLLEGDPNFWKDCLLKLNRRDSKEFDAFLLHHLFKTKLELPIQNGVTFQERLKNCLSTLTLSDISIINLSKIAISIREQLRAVLSQQQDNNALLMHTVLFQEHIPDDPRLKLSVTSRMEEIKEKTYKQFITNANIIETVNKEAAYSWWDYTKISLR